MSVETKPYPDYPYYEGEPIALTWADWLIVLAALAAGFAILTQAPTAPVAVLGKPLYSIIITILFGVIPLGALYWRAKGKIGALFNGFRGSYVGWGILFGLINLVFTVVIGLLATKTMNLARNATVAGWTEGGPPDGALVFFTRTGLQLFGEEVLTILPFLFLLWLGTKSLGLSRKSSVVFAWVGSALIFGATHLPTYQWNVPQALLMIGPVRLVLTLAYMKTKSIWTSAIAHIFNDWTTFILSIGLGSLAAASGG